MVTKTSECEASRSSTKGEYVWRLTASTAVLLALAFQANIASAPRPSLYEDHGILHAEDAGFGHYSVHAGGHFTVARDREKSQGVYAHNLDESVMDVAPNRGSRAHPIENFMTWNTAPSELQIEEQPVKDPKPKPKLKVGDLGKDGELVENKQQCNQLSEAHSVIETMPLIGADYKDQCPKGCPYAAESSDPQKFCHFKCVDAKHCGLETTVKNATIPDHHMKICRRCEVEGCFRCTSGKPGAEVETCEKCMPGYFLVREGEECRSWSIWFFISIIAVAAILLILFMVWYLELLARPIVNEDGLRHALESRARSKVRQSVDTAPTNNPADGIGPRLLYPFDTNLCRTNVAGPGNMLFFRFQAAALIWATVLLASWCIIAMAADPVIFKIGLRKATTPQMMCYVVHWGRQLQVKYRWVKVYWLAFAYSFSFLGAIWYGVNSERLFEELDNEHTTMADFVAVCRSVPLMRGDQQVEDVIKECIENETGEKVLGVSVCWNFRSCFKEVKEALEEDHAAALSTISRQMHSLEAPAEHGPEHGTVSEERSCVGRWCQMINEAVLKKWHCHFHDHMQVESNEAKAARIEEMLRGMQTTEIAFAVFHDEDSRDRALDCVKGKPIPLRDQGFFMEQEIHEPESCCWKEFATTEAEMFWNMFRGVFYMIFALGFWTLMLYLPYAYYMASFSFANGDEPGEMSELIFVSLVVGAQFGLFITANVISHHAGFSYEDDKQNCYIVLYNSALILNLIMDMTLAAYLAYHQMCGRGVRVADGRHLSDLKSLQEILECYPMQKAIGNNLFKYCWPATFFLPFFCEPFGLQVGPYHIGCLLVRSDKRLTGENAEKCLELTEPEQGRYADVIFNAILVAAIPVIAGGYMLITFAALIFSHGYIYFYDHWRVVRCNQRFWFASNRVSNFGQKLFSIPVAMLGAELVFRGNMMSAPSKLNAKGEHVVALGSGALQGWSLWGAMLGVFFGHIILHVLVLEYLIPLFNSADIVNARETYAQCASVTPCTWFSANPVHCLRSKYFWKDDPPQSYFAVGKEYLMKRNTKIHSYFEEARHENAEEKILADVDGGMTITKDGWGAGGL